MKLLSELIAALAREQPNLTDALMKTKVLLHRLGRKDLAEWVNQELNGYPEDAALPEYRILYAGVRGNAANAAYQFTNQPLPTRHLKPEVRNRFEELDMRESIAGVERLAQGKSGSLRRQLPPEANALFEKALIPGTHVTNAWCEIGDAAVINILTQVRSRLLDFLLELQGKVGDDMTEEQAKRVAQSPEVGTSFTQSIYGNNNTILIGNHNTQTIVQVKVRDFESLAKVLVEKGLSDEDLQQLWGAIEADESSANVKDKKFGGRVRTWMGNMMQKAANASWAIELGVAGNLLTDAIKRYYGW